MSTVIKLFSKSTAKIINNEQTKLSNYQASFQNGNFLHSTIGSYRCFHCDHKARATSAHVLENILRPVCLIITLVLSLYYTCIFNAFGESKIESAASGDDAFWNLYLQFLLTSCMSLDKNYISWGVSFSIFKMKIIKETTSEGFCENLKI